MPLLRYRYQLHTLHDLRWRVASGVVGGFIAGLLLELRVGGAILFTGVV